MVDMINQKTGKCIQSFLNFLTLKTLISTTTTNSKLMNVNEIAVIIMFI